MDGCSPWDNQILHFRITSSFSLVVFTWFLFQVAITKKEKKLKRPVYIKLVLLGQLPPIVFVQKCLHCVFYFCAFLFQWTFIGMNHSMNPMNHSQIEWISSNSSQLFLLPTCSFGLKSILLSGGLWEVFEMISRPPLDNDCSAVGEQLCAWWHMTAGSLPQKCTRPSFCHLLWRTCNCSLKSSTTPPEQ